MLVCLTLCEATRKHDCMMNRLRGTTQSVKRSARLPHGMCVGADNGGGCLSLVFAKQVFFKMHDNSC